MRARLFHAETLGEHVKIFRDDGTGSLLLVTAVCYLSGFKPIILTLAKYLQVLGRKDSSTRVTFQGDDGIPLYHKPLHS